MQLNFYENTSQILYIIRQILIYPSQFFVLKFTTIKHHNLKYLIVKVRLYAV